MIYYKHNNPFYFELRKSKIESNGQTLAVDLPHPGFIQPLINQKLSGDATIELQAGVATCHPEDDFSRAIGREVARKNMKPVVFNVYKIVVKDNIEITLENEEIRFTFSVLKTFSGTYRIKYFNKRMLEFLEI